MGLMVIDPFRFAAAGPSISAPTDIADCTVWLDASDTGTLTLSGSEVTTWASKDAGSKSFTNGSAGTRPSSELATQNGLNVLSFDGGDNITHDAGSDALDLSPHTIFIVARLNTGTTTYSRLLTTRRSSVASQDYQSPNLAINRNNANVLTTTCSGSAPTTQPAYTPDAFFIFMVRSDGTSAYHSINGGTESSVAVASPANQRYMRVGASCTNSGNPPTTGDQMTGRMAEVVVYNADLSSGDQTLVLNYLNSKWSVY